MLSTHTEGNDCSDGSKAYMQYLGYLILMSSFVIIFFYRQNSLPYTFRSMDTNIS